ncbi:MAG: AAA family ATPase, partial [Chloroflexia bacterium]
MANSFGSQLAWKLATRAALKGDALTVKPVHLLIGCGMLCDRPLEQQPSANVRVGLEQEITEARGLFARAGLYHPSHFVTLLEQKLNPAVPRDGTARPDPDPDARVLSIIARARVLAWQSGTATGEVRLAHLLLATGELHPAPWDSILRELQAEPLRKSWANVPVGAAPVLTVHEPPPPPVPTPTLDELGRDLTRLARERQLTPQIGREKECAALVAILQQRGKGNPLILGEAGVGKTSLVEGLALYLTGPDAPPSLAKCRVIELAANTLMADTKYRGELEERIKQVLTEAATPNIILFIDEIHTLVQRTHSDGQMLTEAFKPGLNDGRLRIIGATTNDEFTRYIQPDPALERRFQVVRVEEPSRDEAITILNGMRPTLERQQGVIVTGEAVVAAVDLSIRYQPQLRLPAKASDLLLQAAARARIAPPAAGRRSPGALNVGLVDRPQVAQVMAEKVGLPPAVMTAAEGTRLRGLEATLARRVMGQDEAIEALANAIRMSRAG